MRNSQRTPHILPKEPLNKSAAALSGSFAPTYRRENLEIHKVFLQFPNLNLEQNPSLTTLAIESEAPYLWFIHQNYSIAEHHTQEEMQKTFVERRRG